MASLQDKVDAVRAAVSSISTCSPATLVSIKELLLPEADSAAASATLAPSKTRPTTTTTTTTSTSRATSKTASRSKTSASPPTTEQLGAKAKAALATHVVNATIKALGDAAKPQPLPLRPSADDANEIRPTTTALRRHTHRRSNSAPLTPIQPRSLNRVSTSPLLLLPKTTAKHQQQQQSPPAQSTACLATAECARVAFHCLRNLNGPLAPDQTNVQIENGMAALVGKLIALGLHELALKELRLLHRRLDVARPSTATGTAAARKTARQPTQQADASATTTTTLPHLLAFHTPVADNLLAAVTTCQMQVLRLIAATKKPAHIEAALAHLDNNTSPSSPVTLLSALAETGTGGNGGKESAKAARQLASLSQILLSLAPSVSSQEDAVAVEPRLSPEPRVCFELQALAFGCQLRWWKMGGHAGRLDEDLLAPLSRCLRSFARRFTTDDALLYATMTTAVERLLQLAQSHGYLPTLSATCPIATIFQLLGTSAYTAKRYDDATRWFLKLRTTITVDAPAEQQKQKSSVRSASICAWLLAASLKSTASSSSSSLEADNEALARSVLESLDGSLSGTASELNELLDSLSLARRSVVGRLTEILNPSLPKKSRAAEPIDDVLKSFVLGYPRFVRRWLGNAPGKDAPAKHILQFDQRRQLVMKTISQTLDATLMVVKCDIAGAAAAADGAAVEWKQLDEVLQHCAGLVETLAEPSAAQSAARTEQLNGYLVKISSLYFAKFSQLRRQQSQSQQRKREETKQILLALSRSIDTVKDLSAAERERAQLATKLELFADMCKAAGRTDDAVQTLRSICTSMAQDGILKNVAAALSCQAPTIAWNMNAKSSMLSRTLRSIAKLDRSWTDWTIFLPETERAAVLEHLMHLTSSTTNTSSSRGPLRFHDANLQALLRIYTPDKYPIRRLRVLLHVLYQNIGNNNDDDDDDDEVSAVHAHLHVCLRQLKTLPDRAEDQDLAGFVPHLVNWHGSVQAILDADNELSSSAVPDAIDAWAAIMQSCQTESAIYKVIDDPVALQDHLESLGHLAGLRGEHPLQLKISQLLVSLSKVFAGHGQTTSSTLIVRQSQLASHYVSTGVYAKALSALDEATSLLRQQQQSGEMAPSVVVAYNLAQAEYFTGLGDVEHARDSLSALNAVCRRSSSQYQQQTSAWAANKTQATLTVCMASLLQSSLALQSGNTEDALNQIKQSVRMLSHDWAKLESAHAAAAASAAAGNEPTPTTTTSSSDTSIDDSVQLRDGRAASSIVVVGPKVWALAAPLIRSLLHISAVYAHIGMYQETVYYADAASKIAAHSQSSVYNAEVAAWTGSVHLRADQAEKAAAQFSALAGMMMMMTPTTTAADNKVCVLSYRIRHAQLLGEYYSQIGDCGKAVEYLEMAEAGARCLGDAGTEKEATVPVEEATVPAKQVSTTAPIRAKQTRATRARTAAKTPTTTTTTTKRKTTAAAAASKTVVTPATTTKPALQQQKPTNLYQASLLASVLLSRATDMIRQRDWATALGLLAQAKELPKQVDVAYQEQVATATSLIGHSMEQIISDPVFSVIQDSTISLPCVAGLTGSEWSVAESCGSSPGKSPAAKRGRSGTVSRSRSGTLSRGRSGTVSRGRSGTLSSRVKAAGGSKEQQQQPAFAEALNQAQELLAQAHSTAMTKSDSGMMRRVSALLQSTIILLSAACSATKHNHYHHHKSIARSSLATVAVDLAHNVSWRREQKTLAAAAAEDYQAKKRAEPRRASLLPTSSDMAHFHKSYIDMVPAKWRVISISLSDNQHDLCLTKFQAGHSPFILRLPLERANSRDGDCEVFNFEQGKGELLEIIRLANETSHSARDFSLKGERNAWWAEREALDCRLKQWLAQVETTWLGGFKGIFSQHEHRAELLARFQKNVQRMLDRHLPSRNERRGKRKTSKAGGGGAGGGGVMLDARILDVFIGLGDPSCDLDEALNDLLYFIVDILQFHGERNAYDEIDFDAMVVDMYDALRGYHGALEGGGGDTDTEAEAGREEGAHTILILDKALHGFPWESLPCMKGLAVSRVPSLACLRELMSECKLPGTSGGGGSEGEDDSSSSSSRAAGHYVSVEGGKTTYMLNPSSDLSKTQAYFEGAFAGRGQWRGIVGRAPEEEEFAGALGESEVVLYFGHGSGAQYIRGKTVRRLPRGCRATTFLMGCGSAALTEAGSFECFGPVWNYMMAGCPAVVGTLWDVTDGDIDRFAGRAFEEWGLFEGGTFGEVRRGGGGGGGGDDTVVPGSSGSKKRQSLVEAVARARDACRFRYLNAAAVVVYGIPVYCV